MSLEYRSDVGRLSGGNEEDECDGSEDQAFHEMRVPAIIETTAYFPTAARRKNATLAGRSAILRVRYGYQAEPYGT